MPMSDSDPKDRPGEGRSSTEGADAAREGEPMRIYWENGRLVSHPAAGASSYLSQPPAGWYEDPNHAGWSRWWDGEAWARSTRHPAPGWYHDPDARPDVRKLRYWTGTTWSEQRRFPLPNIVVWGAPIVFAILWIWTGWAAWPASGTCHVAPAITNLPRDVFLAVWGLDVALAAILVVGSYAKWQRIAVPILLLIGAVTVPPLVAFSSAGDCLY